MLPSCRMATGRFPARGKTAEGCRGGPVPGREGQVQGLEPGVRASYTYHTYIDTYSKDSQADRQMHLQVLVHVHIHRCARSCTYTRTGIFIYIRIYLHNEVT